MMDLKTQVSAALVREQLAQHREYVGNTRFPSAAERGAEEYHIAIERLASVLGNYFVDESWFDLLFSPTFYAIRDQPTDRGRPLPLIQAEAERVIRWLEGLEAEMDRVATQDEWDKTNQIPRLIFDTSALLRTGEFDTFPWGEYVQSASGRFRLILPMLVIRQMDQLKDSGREPKARDRLRKIYRILEGSGRGEAPISGRPYTLELLMDPPRHERFPIDDQEIIRRAAYLKDRPGGPLTLVAGDYSLLFTAEAEGLDVLMTPSELKGLGDS